MEVDTGSAKLKVGQTEEITGRDCEGRGKEASLTSILVELDAPQYSVHRLSTTST